MTLYTVESQDRLDPLALASFPRRAPLLDTLGVPEPAFGLSSPDREELEPFPEAVAACWMAYQPIVRWSDGVLVGLEALLRAPASPDRFPCELARRAQRLGGSGYLARSIRTRIAADLATLPEGIPVFVNLEPTDLHDEGLRVGSDALSPYADRVVFELTEREGCADLAGTAARMAELRDLGFRFALDDLGAGCNGLASLADLQVEVVKLDMSLIRGVQGNRTKQRLVGFVRQLCQEAGVMCICEGVEQEAELATLLGLGCDVFQGYLVGVPSRAWTRGDGHGR